MKNVKSASFIQLDNKIPKIIKKSGVVILQSVKAFEKFRWTRKHFGKRPKEGYFIWVTKQINEPLVTCISISSPSISQEPTNLIVIEKDLEIEIQSACNATEKDLSGVHSGSTKVILKENSKLKINHFHSWGKKDLIDSSLDFLLEKGAKLSHTYKCLKTPMVFKTESNINLKENSSANSSITILAKNSKIIMHDNIFLNGKKSNGISRIKVIGDERSKIVAHSKMIANSACTGHVDCMGLLLADSSSVSAIPELINNNKKASLTHEASVGKISEVNLNYLRSRGLTEDEAINLIVVGFLGEEEQLVIKGEAISSELYM